MGTGSSHALSRGRWTTAARVLAGSMALAMTITACGGAGDDDPPTPDVEETAADAGGDDEPAEVGGNVDEPVPEGKVPVRWFVGLGAGSDAPTIDAQEAVVADFNANNDRIHLVLEIVDNTQAFDVLNTQLAAGAAPDIVGPMGIRGRASFPDLWLDLDDLIEAHDYDLSDFDEALIDFYRTDEGQIGLPFAVFPSFLFVNLDLFDEAGLPYPPQEYGAPYVDADGVERPWDIDTMRDVALELTVDADGFDARSDGFDPDQIVQFGFGNIFADLRAMATLFGPGNFVDDAGNAVIPEHWVDALEWYHDGMWGDERFIPNGPYGGSALMNEGNWFESGNLAIGYSHLWYATCCIGGLNDRWDTAVVPEVDGQVTAKLHADTFGIMESTQHPDEAFEVLSYLLGDAADQLTRIYGGMPARISLQDGFFDRVDEESFPDLDINWDVAVDSLSYPDNPSHEAAMPSFLEAENRYAELGSELGNDPDLDVRAGLEQLRQDLQRLFDAAAG